MPSALTPRTRSLLAAAALIGSVALLILVVSPVVQGGQSQRPVLQVVGRLSQQVSVPPRGAIRRAQVRCPSNSAPVSGNLFLGSVLPVFDAPSSRFPGWQAAGQNLTRSRKTFRVGVVCVRGARNLTVTAASSDRAAEEAIRQARQAVKNGELGR